MYPRFNPKPLKLVGIPDKFAVIAPGRLTDFPMEELEKLVGYIKLIGLTPVLLGKTEPNDLPHLRNFSEQADKMGCINLINTIVDLNHVAEIISQCRIMIGMDNGLMHIGMCTKAPMIWGITDEVAYRLSTRPYEDTKTYTTIPNAAMIIEIMEMLFGAQDVQPRSDQQDHQ